MKKVKNNGKNLEYSLTAKERKEKRNAEETKKTSATDAYETNAAAEEQVMADSIAKSKKSTTLIAIIASVAVVFILAALLIPIIMYLVNPYRDHDGVIARFDLSNGMTLEFAINETEYDIAATNFIFLAKNGYFDNTVFYDAQNGWLRFGGYEDQPTRSQTSSNDYELTKHHSQNADFISKFTALPDASFKDPKIKFGYKLNPDSKGETATRLAEEGVLTFLYDKTSTEFQFSYKEQAVNDIQYVSGSQGNVTTYSNELKSTMVGDPLSDETIENIKKIAGTSPAAYTTAVAAMNTKISYGYLWVPPAENVRINTVKVYNLDKSKWRDFDFLKYMDSETESGGKRLRSWTGR